eukprot:111676_1
MKTCAAQIVKGRTNLFTTPHLLRLKHNFSLDNSRKRCLVFPGQGAQYVGMTKDIYDEFPYVKQLIQECDDIVGYSLSDTMFNGSMEDLTTTIKAQPAVLIHSLSLLKVLQNEHGIFQPGSNDFTVAMGLSLGEYSALTASQCFDTEKDAIFLVDKRARAMQECCVNKDSTNEDLQQKMLAIMHDGSLTVDALSDLIQNLDVMKGKDGPYVADIANLNSSRQVVISGHKIALDAVQSELKKQRTKSKYINTGGAFHSALMMNAKDELREVLKDINIKLPFNDNTVISNVDATAVNRNHYSDGDIIKQCLSTQVNSPVSWYPSIVKCIEEFGVTEFVEIGPKATICGMIKEICRLKGIEDISTLNIDKLEDLSKFK